MGKKYITRSTGIEESNQRDIQLNNAAFHLGFRGDIEGLRAVAIILVVSAHAGIAWLEGGFIGVDVFFVLSGYLITGLLIKEIEETGQLNLINFYARRMKRLLPALLLMLISTSILATLFMSPFEQIRQAYYARFAAVWISNIKLAFSNFSYFEHLDKDSIFLHTWSLGVEEQFYLLWPLTIMALYFLKTWSKRYNYRIMVWSMLTIIFTGLIVSIILSYRMPLFGFYFMPSRVWQFALGAFILLWTKYYHYSDNYISGVTFSPTADRILTILSWLGFAGIIISATIIKENLTYPGFWAITPSLCTAIVILAGASTHQGHVSRLLSTAPMQWFGRVSYSWYLWHWPVLALGGHFYLNRQDKNSFLLVLLSLAIAIFSYKFIEWPIRKNKMLSARPWFTLGMSSLLMISTVFGTYMWHKASITWVNLPEQQRFLKVSQDLPALYAQGCDDWHYSSEVKICGSGKPEAEHTALLLGDSIAAQWFPVISNIFSRPNWKVLVMTKSACPMVDEPYFYTRIRREYKECTVWRNSALDKIKQIEPDVVFFSNGMYNFSKSQWIDGSVRVLDKIVPYANDVYIIRSTNVLPFDSTECLSRQKWQEKFIDWGVNCSSLAGNEQETNIHNWLLQASEKYDSVSVLDMNPVLCPDNRCHAERDGYIIYRDSRHLTSSYVRTLNDEFLSRILMIKAEKEH